MEDTMYLAKFSKYVNRTDAAQAAMYAREIDPADDGIADGHTLAFVLAERDRRIRTKKS